jgi:hypothetical protein
MATPSHREIFQATFQNGVLAMKEKCFQYEPDLLEILIRHVCAKAESLRPTIFPTGVELDIYSEGKYLRVLGAVFDDGEYHCIKFRSTDSTVLPISSRSLVDEVITRANAHLEYSQLATFEHEPKITLVTTVATRENIRGEDIDLALAHHCEAADAVVAPLARLALAFWPKMIRPDFAMPSF